MYPLILPMQAPSIGGKAWHHLGRWEQPVCARKSRHAGADVRFYLRYCNNFSITLPVVNSMPSFTDASSITSALLPAVTAACRADIFHGYPDGSFRPKQTITKAEACNVLTLLHGIKYNSASQLNMYIKDKDGNAVTSAACYFYTASYGNMSWTPGVFGFRLCAQQHGDRRVWH